MSLRFIFFILLYCFPTLVLAQMGSFFIQNYSKQQYDGDAKVWCVAQAPNKILYMGQAKQLLEYDGVKWRKIIEKIIVRSIAFDEQSNIYVAAEDDFGVIENVGNEKKFTSFLPLLPDSIKKVTFIVNVICYKDYVYFTGENELYIYQRSTNTIITAGKIDDILIRPTIIYNTVYLISAKYGLVKAEGNKITPVPNLQNLNGNGTTRNITAVCSRGIDELVIITNDKGLLTYNIKNSTLNLIKTPINDWIIKNTVYTATQFTDKQGKSYYILGSAKDGIYIIDQKWQLIQHINKANKLLDNTINSLSIDYNNNVWAATNKGVSQIFTSLPFMEFGVNQNIQSSIYDILMYKDKLYLGTRIGVMLAKENQFEFIDKMPSTQSWDLQAFAKGIIVAGGNYGFYYLVHGQISQNIEADWATIAIGVSLRDSNIVFNAKYQGFEVLQFQHGKFVSLGEINALAKTINRSVFEDKNGSVWVGVPKEGFYRINFEGSINKASVKNAKVTFHTKGLEEVADCYVIRDASQQLIFSTRSGLYTFNEKSQVFELYNPYQIDYKQKRYKGIVPSFDTQNNAWLTKSLTILRKHNQKYLADSITLQPILEPINRFWEDKDSIYWLATEDKLYKYDAKYKVDRQASFPTLVRMVKISSLDSILCSNNCSIEQQQEIILPYKYNSLLFEYATLNYYLEKENQYQYKLEGYEHNWSKWTKETYKEYTNLPEGTYKFVVRAKNALQEMSTEVSYTFVIQPPIYRTWAAYLVYVLGTIIIIYYLIKFNTRRLMEAKRHLENIVQQRTKEIQLKNIELEQQKEEIFAQSENLRLINEEVKVVNVELLNTLELVKSQKIEIERQHNDIKDSISYAQRIQNAMLPFEEKIQKSLPDFFIFYQPRDVVSGDFYWFYDTSVPNYYIQDSVSVSNTEKDNKIIIVVADCTGHGVPGAFMSMIGNELLNQIVNTYHITSPDKILETLHRGVLYALKQEQTNNKDGMDVAIVVLTKYKENNKTFFQKMEYSGAMNPLYLITEKNSEILPDYLRQNPALVTDNAAFFDIKATKHPIGGYFENEEFVSFDKHTFDLTKMAANETLKFYLCSDGYQDQFGGEKESKFMTRRFKKLLFDIYEKPLLEQKDILEQTFINWKGNCEQIDDVLVMGVKI